MFKKMLLVSFLVSLLSADSVNIFVASSAKTAMTEIADEFKKEHKDSDIKLSFGASGKAYAQFSGGFTYDMFFSADSSYPAKIIKDGNAASESKIYALGVVALFTTQKELLKDGIKVLESSSVKHISIANPKVAPYGVAAIEILQNYGIKEAIEKKLVMGDNIAQSVQFVDSGAAEVGLVALSLIKNIKDESQYVIIDSSKYRSLEQSFVITKYGKDNKTARQFAEFVVSAKAKEIFKKYGFGTN